MTNQIDRTRARAFSLVELLTVIGILAIVIAIIIPALRYVRTTARIAATKTLLTQVGNACSSFQADQRRKPGYFSPLQMANANNATTDGGFSGWDNVMLDLLGGVTKQAASAPARIYTVGPGPNAADEVNVDLNAIGSTTQSKTGTISRAYLTLDQKNFVAQKNPGQRASSTDNAELPELVDNFGTPVLVWSQDDNPRTDRFSEIAAPAAAANNGYAQFYWNPNYAFLDAGVTSLGKLAQSQSYAAAGSILAGDNSTANRTKIMEALLGSPSAPDTSAPAATPRPLTARGPIMIHSAGPDGIYLGKLDRGGRSGVVQYTPNQDPFGGGQFDDIHQGAGH